PEERPSAHLRERFDAMLDRESPRGLPWWRLPAWQAVAAAILVIAGWAAGRSLPSSGDVNQMRSEIRDLREAVALSLLQQGSASERLRGVSYSSRVEDAGADVVGALVSSLRNDPSVDVRLAALDALRRYAGRPQVREGLVDALARRQSPLVQIALVDSLVALKEPRARAAFETLLQDPDLHPADKDGVAVALRGVL
ncbi:MAG: HEAT repeat domain-containing protein, partial [Bryobacteraceae bacterium]